MEFKVSAPGKLILFGEHAVVYQKTAVAGAVDLRTVLAFKELPQSDSMIHLDLPAVQLDLYIPLLQILEYFSLEKCPKAVESQDEFYKYIKTFVDTLDSKNNQQRLALEALIYSLIMISQNEGLVIQPFKITITTELAVSSGLGSSASFSVCISAAFLNWSYHQNGKELVLDVDTLAVISQYAFQCEKIMHGSPSGIDNSVCTHGSILRFKNKELQPLAQVKSMKVMLVDTKVSRSTKVLVEKLASLKQEFPSVYNPILEAIDSVATKALSIIEQIRDLDMEKSTVAVKECYERLMIMISVNQSLLSTCQVSHPALDDICAEAKKHGLAGKLTGAGGGGYAYVLLSPDTSDDVVNSLMTVLGARGYKVTLTYLGGPGVQIHGYLQGSLGSKSSQKKSDDILNVLDSDL